MQDVQDILQEIITEIDRSRALWRSKRSSEEQYKFWGSHLLVLQEKVRRMGALWYDIPTEAPMRQEFIKIAAIALRALMEVE